MPYEVFPDGRVRADTADEVRALWATLSTPILKPAMETKVSEDSWTIFTRLLSPEWHRNQQQLLSTLKKMETPIEREAFRRALGPAFTSNNVVGGTVAGISRHAKKAGLDLATIVIREGRTYRPGPLLREHDLPWDT